MSINPASDIASDPLDYYYRSAKTRRYSHSSHGSQSEPKGVYPKPLCPSDHTIIKPGAVVPHRSSRSGVMEGCLSVLRCLENVPVVGHLVSAGYACAGNKDKAERAGLKASVGILMCVCNFPAEVLDESTAKRSPKLDSPGLMNRQDWMKRHRRRQLRHLCLPGSHQTATYHMSQKLKPVPLVEGWSRCQKLSVDAQLYGGIRFLDLRVMSHQGDIWLHHNLVVCTRLRDVLQCVGDFVIENPSEIVFIHLSSDGKQVDWSLVQTYIHEHMGDRLIMEHMKDMLIGDIIDQGRNISIAGVPNVAYGWRGIQYRWPNKNWPHELREDIEFTLSDMSSQPSAALFWYKAECTPNVPMVVRNLGGVPGLVSKARGGEEKYEFVEDMAAAVNHQVYEVLQGLTRMPFNVLSTDFVQDDIVGQIIQLNDEADEGHYTADETAENLDDVFTLDTSVLVTSQPGRVNQNTSISNVSILTAKSNTSFDIRLKPGPPLEVKETNM